MSIGVVMFFKALVMAVLVAIGEAWKAFRKRREERGLPLRKNRQGVYVVSDWAAKLERAAIRTWDAYLWFLFVFTVTLAAWGWWTGRLFN